MKLVQTEWLGKMREKLLYTCPVVVNEEFGFLEMANPILDVFIYLFWKHFMVEDPAHLDQYFWMGTLKIVI